MWKAGFFKRQYKSILQEENRRDSWSYVNSQSNDDWSLLIVKIEKKKNQCRGNPQEWNYTKVACQQSVDKWRKTLKPWTYPRGELSKKIESKSNSRFSRTNLKGKIFQDYRWGGLTSVKLMPWYKNFLASNTFDSSSVYGDDLWMRLIQIAVPKLSNW